MTINDTTTPAAEPTAESLADDLLTGADEIGAFLGMTPRQLYYAYESTSIPLFKFSNSPRAELHGRKSTLRQWVADRERDAAAERAAAREAKRAAKRRKPGA